MQIAHWKTQDGKHWLKLFEANYSHIYSYLTNDGSNCIDGIFLKDALRHVKGIMDYWPSKGIRQH